MMEFFINWWGSSVVSLSGQIMLIILLDWIVITISLSSSGIGGYIRHLSPLPLILLTLEMIILSHIRLSSELVSET